MLKIKKLCLLFTLLMSVSVMTTLVADDRSDKLSEAQKKMEEAAREYAELSSELGGEAAAHIVQSFNFSSDDTKGSKARLGINIGEIKIEKFENGETTTSPENVDGVLIHGVSPEGPAEQAGLKAGDIITSLNGQVLLDNADESAVDQLVENMQDIMPGATVDVVYKRDGVSQSASVLTDEMPKGGLKMLFGENNFDFNGPGDIDLQGLESLKNLDVFKDMGDIMGEAKFIFMHSSPLGDAELTELTPELGEYFGTDEGLLVVKAPSDESIELHDGDVIKEIDGRVPTSVNHAMRIFRSYQAGETVNLDILRKKRKRKVTLTIADKPEMPHVKSWHFDKNSDDALPQKENRRIMVINGQEKT